MHRAQSSRRCTALCDAAEQAYGWAITTKQAPGQNGANAVSFQVLEPVRCCSLAHWFVNWCTALCTKTVSGASLRVRDGPVTSLLSSSSERAHMKLFFASAASLLSVCGLQAQTIGSWTDSGAGCPNPNLVILSLGDDDVQGPFNLPFTFNYDGGSTTAIDIVSNGWIYLQPGVSTASRCCNSTTGSLTTDPAHINFWGQDLDPETAGTVTFDADATSATVTFEGVPEFGQPNANDIQVVLNVDGSFWISYQAAFNANHTAGAGFSPGAAANLNAQDLSAGVAGAVAGDAIHELFAVGTEDLTGSTLMFTPNGAGSYDVAALPLIWTAPATDTPMQIGSSSTPTIGQTTTIDLINAPASTAASVLFIGTTNLGGIPLDVIGMEQCNLFTSPDIAQIPLTGGSASVTIANDPGNVGLNFHFQGAGIAPGANTLGVITSNLGTMSVGDTNPIVISAEGSNSFNSATGAGYFQVVNNNVLDIIGLEFDWSASSNPAQGTMVFDTDQTGMADRPDGGNSTTAGCLGTYRLGSDVATGMDYVGTDVPSCDATANSGFVKSNGGAAPTSNSVKTLTWTFTDFNFGETFHFDCDTDGGAGIAGGAMAGMVVTITLSDLTVLTGELVQVSPTRCELQL